MDTLTCRHRLYESYPQVSQHLRKDAAEFDRVLMPPETKQLMKESKDGQHFYI